MKVRSLMVFAALLAVSAVGYAQGPAGTWTGEMQGRGGAQMVTVVLNTDGTGTYKQGEGEAMALSEVKIDGSMVSFQRTFPGRGGNDITLSYTGQAEGNQLTLNISFPGGGGGGGGGGRGRGGQMPLVLTRQ